MLLLAQMREKADRYNPVNIQRRRCKARGLLPPNLCMPQDLYWISANWEKWKYLFVRVTWHKIFIQPEYLKTKFSCTGEPHLHPAATPQRGEVGRVERTVSKQL